MTDEQKGLLHSVIAHGATSLREKKLVLEGQLKSREGYIVLGLSQKEKEKEQCVKQVLESEISKINDKLDIAQEVMAELEGARKYSEITRAELYTDFHG